MPACVTMITKPPVLPDSRGANKKGPWKIHGPHSLRVSYLESLTPGFATRGKMGAIPKVRRGEGNEFHAEECGARAGMCQATAPARFHECPLLSPASIVRSALRTWRSSLMWRRRCGTPSPTIEWRMRTSSAGRAAREKRRWRVCSPWRSTASAAAPTGAGVRRMRVVHAHLGRVCLARCRRDRRGVESRRRRRP